MAIAARLNGAFMPSYVVVLPSAQAVGMAVQHALSGCALPPQIPLTCSTAFAGDGGAGIPPFFTSDGDVVVKIVPSTCEAAEQQQSALSSLGVQWDQFHAVEYSRLVGWDSVGVGWQVWGCLMLLLLFFGCRGCTGVSRAEGLR